MSLLDTLPSSIDVGTGENVPYTIDVTNALLVGESLQSSPAPTAKIVTNANNSTVSGAVNTPTVSGNQITVTIVGSALRPKLVYTLVVGWNTTATKVLQSKTTVNAVI